MTAAATDSAPTPAQRIAMAGVLNKAVRLDGRGQPTVPSSVSAAALQACLDREWVAWDLETRLAFITEKGWDVLR